MTKDLSVILPNTIALIFVLILIGLFIFHAKKQNRPVKNILNSLFWGMIYGILVIVYGFNIIPSEIGQNLLQASYLTCLSIQTIFFFVFFVNTKALTTRTFDIIVIIGLFSMQILCWYLIAFFSTESGTSGLYYVIELIAGLSFNLIPVYIYGYIGIPIYYRMYKHTNEKKPLILLLTMIMTTTGYILIIIHKIAIINVVDTNSLLLIKLIGDVLPVLGILVFMLLYASNIQYIYRLPFDHYVLMITHKSGLKILHIQFETKDKDLDIEENLFSGMMTAINTVFNHVLEVEKPIRMILNDDVSILMQSGKNITAIVATNQISGVLAKGLEIFVTRFENMMGEKLEQTPTNLEEYVSGIDLFMRIFPFLIRKNGGN